MLTAACAALLEIATSSAAAAPGGPPAKVLLECEAVRGAPDEAGATLICRIPAGYTLALVRQSPAASPVDAGHRGREGLANPFLGTDLDAPLPSAELADPFPAGALDALLPRDETRDPFAADELEAPFPTASPTGRGAPTRVSAPAVPVRGNRPMDELADPFGGGDRRDDPEGSATGGVR